MKLYSLIFIILISFFSNSLMAGVWTSAGKLTRVQIGNTGDLTVEHEDMTVNPGSCSSTDFYRMPVSESHLNNVASFALAVYIANQKVSLWIESSCYNNRPKLNAIKIEE